MASDIAKQFLQELFDDLEKNQRVLPEVALQVHDAIDDYVMTATTAPRQ